MKNWFKKKLFSIIFLPIMLFLFYKFREIEKGEIFSYFFLVLAMQPLNDLLPNWKIFKPLKFVFSLIIGIILLIGPIYKSLFHIFIAVLYPATLIALLIKYTPEYVFGIDLKLATKLYLFLITIIILNTYFIKGILTKVTNWMSSKSKEEKKTQLELTLVLANKNRIRFIIYLFFFIYLIYFSIIKLNNYNIFDNSGVNQSIFYSFISFLALERVSSNLELMNFNPKKFFKKASNIWENLGYFDEVNNKNNSLDNNKKQKNE